MEWTADVSAGNWLTERLGDGRSWGGTMHGVVPRGFDAYARIFHPATRDRPVGVAWPPVPYAAHAKEWNAFQSAHPEIDEERVTWSDTASAFGTTMHALAQWSRIVGPRQIEGEDGPRDAAGWRYSEPLEGSLEPDLVSAVASILAHHTTTPDDGFVAVWEGWGGIVGMRQRQIRQRNKRHRSDNETNPHPCELHRAGSAASRLYPVLRIGQVQVQN